jgi:hypothetical protein
MLHQYVPERRQGCADDEAYDLRSVKPTLRGVYDP